MTSTLSAVSQRPMPALGAPTLDDFGNLLPHTVHVYQHPRATGVGFVLRVDDALVGKRRNLSMAKHIFNRHAIPFAQSSAQIHNRHTLWVGPWASVAMTNDAYANRTLVESETVSPDFTKRATLLYLSVSPPLRTSVVENNEVIADFRPPSIAMPRINHVYVLVASSRRAVVDYDVFWINCHGSVVVRHRWFGSDAYGVWKFYVTVPQSVFLRCLSHKHRANERSYCEFHYFHPCEALGESSDDSQ